MSIVILVLLVLAFVFFVLSTVGIPAPPRFHFMAAGLACWVLTVILSAVKI